MRRRRFSSHCSKETGRAASRSINRRDLHFATLAIEREADVTAYHFHPAVAGRQHQQDTTVGELIGLLLPFLDGFQLASRDDGGVVMQDL